MKNEPLPTLAAIFWIRVGVACAAGAVAVVLLLRAVFG